MNNRHLLRGLFLVAISLAFGIGALQYRIGHFDRAGPGLFPLMVSCLLLLIGIATIVRSRYIERLPIEFNVRNIAIILASLCGFALVSEHFKMIAGIVFMVFCASFAARTYSISRNVKVAAGLIAIALAFQKLLGFNLPLY
jgi:tripartite tricarboxylate transporter TctB family protein